ncbi:hypothetical protein LV85_03533 [Algoriphagus chordae]|uniref:Uncharacterized protein n=1 Tax=Algoriphagus chordae TaxID=237019 RepID=A0A2W7QJI6_9BACT|nr:hypothetical protein LV85_03533 [Algoriphagus chordae]
MYNPQVIDLIDDYTTSVVISNYQNDQPMISLLDGLWNCHNPVIIGTEDRADLSKCNLAVAAISFGFLGYISFKVFNSIQSSFKNG